MADYKTIMVTTETHELLCRLKTEIEKIFDACVSFDKVIRFLITAKIDWSELLSLISEEDVRKP